MQSIHLFSAFLVLCFPAEGTERWRHVSASQNRYRVGTLLFYWLIFGENLRYLELNLQIYNKLLKQLDILVSVDLISISASLWVNGMMKLLLSSKEVAYNRQLQSSSHYRNIRTLQFYVRCRMLQEAGKTPEELPLLCAATVHMAFLNGNWPIFNITSTKYHFKLGNMHSY